jgi:hypothetical protein
MPKKRVTKKKPQDESDALNRWNIPDWRKAELYSKPNSLTLPLWKWEFLRRDEQYRKDWEHYAALDHPFKLALTGNPHERKLLVPFYPRQYRDQWADVWKMAKKYGLLRLPDPSIKVPRLLSFFQIPQDGIQVWLDLTRPLNPQLSAYSKLLGTLQKRRHGHTRRDRPLDRSQWPSTCVC